MTVFRLILFLFPGFLSAQLTFDVDFEAIDDFDGSTGSFRTINVGGGQVSNVSITGNAREGSGAARFVYAGGERNEATLVGAVFNWRTEYWVGYSVKVVEDVDGFRIATQFRPSTSGVNTFEIKTLSETRLALHTSTNPDNVNACVGTSASWGGVTTDVDIANGQWNDIVLHFFNDEDADGYMEIWVNGVKVVDVQNAPTVYTKEPDILGCADRAESEVPKIGIYFGPSATKGEVHFDAYRIWQGAGGSYEDVSPLGLSPGAGGGTPPIIPSIGSGKQKTGTSQLIAH